MLEGAPGMGYMPGVFYWLDKKTVRRQSPVCLYRQSFYLGAPLLVDLGEHVLRVVERAKESKFHPDLPVLLSDHRLK